MKPMRIVIYSPDKEEAAFYEAQCRTLSETFDIPVECKIYTATPGLLFDLGDPAFSRRLDVIYFSLNKQNVDIPHQIRDAGYTNLIVFIGKEEMVLTYEEMFDIETYNFVQSDRAPEYLRRFAHIFRKAGEVVAKSREEKLVLSYGGEIRQIDINDIHYFEVRNYTLIVHYGDGEQFTFVSSLAKMEQHLKGRNFLRPSRFYLISLRAVQTFTSDRVLMRDGTEIAVSRKYSGMLKRALDEQGGRGGG
ncbi:MAG: LytTR family transcriptional regulator DNA-binding domain-containing protein [Oscillospiraceae bacterium]|nr:LytTR family transcriptional regulator DNA-binding domain-containing protein [Oscillospiraceae bacterium]